MKDIIGFEGKYAITSCGKVWSYGRKKFLKAFRDCNGYNKVNLCKDGKYKQYMIHRLVMNAYNPTDDITLECNHIDEKKDNNCLNNLEWVSHKYNCNYGSRN